MIQRNDEMAANSAPSASARSPIENPGARVRSSAFAGVPRSAPGSWLAARRNVSAAAATLTPSRAFGRFRRSAIAGIARNGTRTVNARRAASTLIPASSGAPRH
ncbi:MAG: hypothetical protein AABY30_06615 [Candidatus Thermoplasmatota archaeon]